MGPVTVLWGTTYAAFGLVCAVIGRPLFHGLGARASSGLDYAVVAVGALAALVGAAVVRCGLRTGLRVLLWMLCGLSGIAAFSLLMDLITLLFGQGVDSWAAAANRAMAAVGVLLLVATDRSFRRRPPGTTCPYRPVPPRGSNSPPAPGRWRSCRTSR